VAWVQKNWLKGRSFWEISIPQNCHWSWKKLLNFRSITKQFISFKVGNGNNIFLWHDIWHPIGDLLDTYGSRVVYDAGPSIGPKLSSIIRCGEWYWPQARSNDLVVIQSLLPDIEIGEVDQSV